MDGKEGWRAENVDYVGIMVCCAFELLVKSEQVKIKFPF